MDVCDPETRENYATLTETLMDIDSNFDGDYNSINMLKTKNKKKESEIKQKKKVTFECTDKHSTEETFDYEHEDDLFDEDTFNEDCEDETVSEEEGFIDIHEKEFDYDHKEKFDYDHNEKNKFSKDDYFDSESYKESLNDNFIKTDKKNKNIKEDIYGRMRKPDGTIVVSNLFLILKYTNYNCHVLITGTICLYTSIFKKTTK